MGSTKLHPADIADREQIASAIEFTAFLRLSPADKIVNRHRTLAEALIDAAAIRAAHPGRDCLVYAVTASGVSIPVPKHMQKAVMTAARALERGREKGPRNGDGHAAVLPSPKKSARPPRAPGKRAALIEAAKRGELPAKPDFSAPTHARFRVKLNQIAAMADAGDIDGLKAFEINPISSSRQAMDRYRNVAVLALKARRIGGQLPKPHPPGDA